MLQMHVGKSELSAEIIHVQDSTWASKVQFDTGSADLQREIKKLIRSEQRFN
jgi:hypothetical protein